MKEELKMDIVLAIVEVDCRRGWEEAEMCVDGRRRVVDG